MNQNIPLPPINYRPTENEPYMNHVMLAYFEKKLSDWKKRLLQESSDIQHSIEDQTERFSDHVDAGTIEESHEIEYSIARKDFDLMQQIDNAIERIANGSYGFCEETKQAIGIKRLEAWPIATLTTKFQKEKEQAKIK